MSTTPPMPIPTFPGGPNPGSSRFKPIDLLGLLRRNLRLFVIVGIVGVVLGVGIWFLLLKTMPKYASSAQLRVSEGVVNPGQVASDVGTLSLASLEPYIQSEVYKIQSEEILTTALAKPEVRNTQWFAQYENKDSPGTYDVNKAREDLLDSHLSVSMIRNTQLINVMVGTTYEKDCQKIAKAIVDEYLRRIMLDTENKVNSQLNTLVTELNSYDQTILNLTSQIEDYTQEHELTNLDSRLEEAAQNMQYIIEKRNELEDSLKEAQSYYDSALEKQASGAPPDATAIAQASQSDAIKLRDERLRSLREQREVSLYEYGPEHRIIKQIDRQITATEAERERELERVIRENEQAMLSSYKQAIDTMTEKIAGYNDEILELRDRLIDLNLHQTGYANLQARLEDAKEAKQRIEADLSEVRMIKKIPEARPVQLQSNPSLPELIFPEFLIIVPLVLMVLVGGTAAIVLLLELLDQSIKSPADVKLLKEAELLGIVPHADEDPSGPSSVERVVEKYPSGLLAEAYRQVRTSILGKMDRRGYKTLLVASAQPNSGTSSLTHNLATSLAFNGRKVAIVDVNFRRPAQHLFVDASNDRGLVDILLYGASLDDMLITVQDPDLAVLPTGRAGDAQPELLEGARFRSLIGELESRFDIILIDAPPALLSSECQVLTRNVDAVAVVVRAGNDKRGMVDRMAGQFEGQRADLLGLVLNGVQSSVGGYFRSNFRNFYRYRENGNGQSNGRGRRASVDVEDAAEIK